MDSKTFLAMSATPQKLRVNSTMSQWAALLLAVSDCAGVAIGDLLYSTPRAGRTLLNGRRLLVWAFREVCDVEEPEAIAWLTMTMTGIGKRTIQLLLADTCPEGLREVVESYARLESLIGYDELREAVGAGVFGFRDGRSRTWTKGFTESLGLRDM